MIFVVVDNNACVALSATTFKQSEEK